MNIVHVAFHMTSVARNFIAAVGQDAVREILIRRCPGLSSALDPNLLGDLQSCDGYM
jgi:hypothetical protein